MNEQIVAELKDVLVSGDKSKTEELTREALAQGVPAKTLIIDSIKAAADVVGEKYENGEYFLANLVRCGDSFKVAIKQIDDHLKSSGDVREDGKQVVIATVEGDIHDIGKNLVVTFLQGDGFAVEDLGVDVPAQKVVDKAIEVQADVIALSCLMSVTRDGVKKVCQELEDRGLRDRFSVLVGGAATNEKWANQVGCDGWAASATEATLVAHDLIAMRQEV